MLSHLYNRLLPAKWIFFSHLSPFYKNYNAILLTYYTVTHTRLQRRFF